MYAHIYAAHTYITGLMILIAYYTSAIHVNWTKHAHKMSTSCIATRAESYLNYA